MIEPEDRVLKHLRPGCPPLSLVELAELSGLTEATTSACIHQLQASGYVIESVPHRGLRRAGDPSQLMAGEIAMLLEGRTVGREVIVLRETRSTNDLATRAGQEGAEGGLVFLAEKQTGGRGRHGRTWESADGENVMLSVLLRPRMDPCHWTRLTLAAAVAVAESVESFCDVETGIKWPNDVQVADRKICGILLESCIAQSGDGFVVVGIGLNVNETDFPPEIAPLATSMRNVGGKNYSRTAVAAELLKRLDITCSAAENDFPALLQEATRRSTLSGREIILSTGQGELRGRAIGFDGEGGLIVETPDGAHSTVTSGEVLRVLRE